MAHVCLKMAGEEEGESPAKCREARRRRIEMRRFAEGEPPIPGLGEKRKEAEASERPSEEKRSRTGTDDPQTLLPPPSSSSASSLSPSGRVAGAVASTSGPVGEAAVPPLAFGSVSLSGRSREMEDAVSVLPGFFRPAGGSLLHFFAVFDGHGGAHVSALCKERMHVLLAEELASADEEEEKGKEEEERWRTALGRCFGRMDALAMAACACGRVGTPPCGCQRSGIESEFVGSTAVVALLAPQRLLVANCGDSRAVLSRGGRALALSSDHKPDRPDEMTRIEAAGGRVIYVNGARVDGILAMSRALGDKFLKPVVISEPDIMIVERTPEDECLIIASDGLWDVVPNDLACDVARRCLEEGNSSRTAEDTNSGVNKNRVTGEGEQHASEDRCSLAAALLARLALGRKSADNISVIVIDLGGRQG